MTTQYPERLRFNRRVHDLLSEPLESYFDDRHPKPKAFVVSCTSCWRGYVAGWCIKRGKLYLEKLEPFCYGGPQAEEIEFTFDVASGVKVPTLPHYLTRVFPGVVTPVFAEWFSGELSYLSPKFYSGKLVSEWDALQAASVMHVEHGILLLGVKDVAD